MRTETAKATPEDIAEALRSISGRRRSNKFHARAIVIDGVRFDSQREAARWSELLLLERAGLIRSLVCHPSFAFALNGIYLGKYTADSEYREGASHVVEDVKSKPTRKLRDYRLRVKLFQAFNPGIVFREVE